MTFRSLDDGVKPRKLNNDFTYFERLSSPISADASDLSESSGRQVVSEALEVQSNSTRFLSFLFSEGLAQVHVLVACASSSTFELVL